MHRSDIESAMNPDDPISASFSNDAPPAEGVSLKLLAAAQGGDNAALHELVARYQERLHRIVRIQLGRSSLRRQHDSMDFVQDTFLAALPKIHDLRPRSPGSLLHWLSVIATHQIRDALDHQCAQKRDIRRTTPLAADSTPGAILPPATTPDPAEAAQLTEIRDLLDSEVARLPGDQRRVVLLRDYCGESWQRIADELHRESGATRQLHQRAWITLRKRLRPSLRRNSD